MVSSGPSFSEAEGMMDQVEGTMIAAFDETVRQEVQA